MIKTIDKTEKKQCFSVLNMKRKKILLVLNFFDVFFTDPDFFGSDPVFLSDPDPDSEKMST